MSELFRRVRSVNVPNELATEKLRKILDQYVLWFDGDIPAAKVALIQDIIESGSAEEVSQWRAGILEAVKVGNG
ncbi:MAG: hypothetical protein K6L80_03350 [Agarilytica sp.]